MSVPESYPFDRCQNYQCPECGGCVTENENLANCWECDTCDFFFVPAPTRLVFCGETTTEGAEFFASKGLS